MNGIKGFRMWVGLLCLAGAAVQAGPPVLSNIRVSQREAGLFPVDIYYTVNDAQGRALIVTAAVLDNGVEIPTQQFTGDVGVGIYSGTDRHIVWNAPVDWPEADASNVQVVLTAKAIQDVDDVPVHMVEIPAGEFQMGNSTPDDTFFDASAELPVHDVYVSGFWMDPYEVSWTLWNEVRDWAVLNGYADLAVGGAKGDDHPVHSVDWHEAVKWCNARSEMESRQPVYYLDSTFTQVYRSGQREPHARWQAAGYRLPTEAEWEKAARGGLEAKRFALGDTISFDTANYTSAGMEDYDLEGPGPDTIRFQGFEEDAADTWGCDIVYFDRTPAITDAPAAPLVYADTVNPRSGDYALRLQGSADGTIAPAVVFQNVDLRRYSGVKLTLPYSAMGPDSGDDLHIGVSYDGGQTWLRYSSGSANAWGEYVVDAPTTGNFQLPYDTVLDATAQPFEMSPLVLDIPDTADQFMFRLIFFNATGTSNLTDFYDIDDVMLTGWPAIVAQGFDSDDGETAPWAFTTNFYNNSGIELPFQSSPVETVVSSLVLAGDGAMRLQGAPNSGTNGAIVFQNVDISSYANVKVMLSLAGENLGSNNTLRVAASTNGSASWFAPDGNGAASTLGRGIGVAQATADSWGYNQGTAAQCPNGNPYVWAVPDEADQLMFRVSFGGNYADNTSDFYYIDEVRLFGEFDDILIQRHPDYDDGVEPLTAPVGSFPANGYGLYEMNGNIWEWCWDWYSTNENFYAGYTNTPSSVNTGYIDPKGLESGDFRILRGGGWNALPWYSRNSWRGAYDFVNLSNLLYGFRTVMNASQIVEEDTAGITSADFALDTRANIVMQVTGLSSTYCDGAYGSGGRHVYFLQGIDLSLPFTATVDPGRKTIQSIVFNGVTQSWPNTTRTYNVGKDFKAGGSLSVVAVATDGTRSLPFRANFDVMKVLPPFGENLFTVETNSTLAYRTTTNSPLIKLFQGKSGTVSDSVPLPESGIEIAPQFRAEAVISGSAGNLTIQAARTNIGLYNNVQSDTADNTFGKFAGAEFNLDVGGKVIADWQIAKQGWKVSSGLLTAHAYGHYTTKPYYVYATPPIYLKASIDAELYLSLLIQDLGTGSGWTPNFTARSDTFPKLTGVLGVGASSLLALEGQVALSGAFTVSAPPVACTRLGVSGSAGARLYLFGFSTKTLNIWSGTYWIVGNATSSKFYLVPEGDAPAFELAAMTADDFQPISRAYLNAPQPRRMSRAAEDGSSVVLEANGFPYPAPALANDGRAILYLRDNPGRTLENRTELVESINDGDAWEAPTAVWDDGTGDFMPQVVSLADGTLLAAWVNAKSILRDGADLDAQLESLEIAIGERNPLTDEWTCRNLTDNAVLDHTPILAADADGNAMLVWIRNAANNPYGAPEEPNALYYSIRRNGNWTAEALLLADAGSTPYMDLDVSGTLATLAFVMDGDGDLGTPEDQDIYTAAFDGTAWSAAEQWTANDVQDTRPYVRYNSDGTAMILWHQDGLLLSSAIDSLDEPAIIGELGLGSGARDFKLVTGPAGQMAVIWQDTEEDAGGIPDPYILNYDPLQNAWSRPVRLLENDTVERDFNGLFTADGNLQLAYAQVEVDWQDDVPVLAESATVCVLTHAVGPDPAILAGQTRVAADSAAPGTPITITAGIKNLGELGVENLVVRLYNGNPSQGASTLGDQLIADLPGGAAADATFQWVLPDIDENVALYVAVDPDLETEDRNRANNSAMVFELTPDVRITDKQVAKQSTTQRRLKARVQNEGTILAPAGMEIEFRLDSIDGPLLHTDQLGLLQPAAANAYDAGFFWDMPVTFTTSFVNVYAVLKSGSDILEDRIEVLRVMTPLDSDGDKLLDGEEEEIYGTNPLSTDSDGDGLDDYEEVAVYGTAPLNKDTDGDGATDGNERDAGTDPNDKADLFAIFQPKDLDDIQSKAFTAPRQIYWSVKSNKTYHVQWIDDLTSTNDWYYVDEEDPFAKQTATENGYLVYPLPLTEEQGPYYRIKLVQP